MRCLSESYCIKESSDQNSWYIAGSLILFSVFLFAKDENRQALATNLIYTDVLLASNWQTSKQWERWPMPLFISLAQTLLCNRFWRYTCVVSAEVITLWTILQGKGSPLNYTLDKFRTRKSILWTVFLARFVWVCLKYNHKRYWLSLFGQDGWTLAQFFCCVFMDLDFVSVPRDAKIKRG